MGVISSSVAGTIGTAVLLGAGTGAAVMASQRRSSPRPATSTPNLPTPQTAEELAREETLKKRRIIARTGGKTILTSQYADTQGKNLLGE